MSVSDQDEVLLVGDESPSSSTNASASGRLNIARCFWREITAFTNSRSHSTRPHSRDMNLLSSNLSFRKDKERNFVAAFCSVMVVIIIIVALVEPHWIYMSGGGCDHSNIGANQFFYNGHFSMRATVSTNVKTSTYKHVTQDLLYHYGPNKVMTNCVTGKAVKLMKMIICLSLIAILISSIGVLLDVIGSKKRPLAIIRRNALPAILTALLCVFVDGFLYWVTVELATLQYVTKVNRGSKVSVSFGVSFYLLAAAGGLSVIATAFNCLRRHRDVPSDSEIEDLMNDHNRLLAEGPCIESSSSDALPLPPAYSP